MKAGKKTNAEAQRGRDAERTERWPLVRLGDVCEVRAGADYKAVLAENGLYPIYGTGGEMGRASQWRCPANSVIVGRKGTLDNPMLITEPFWNIDTCFGVIPSESIVPEYLYRFCQNFDFYSLVPASGRPSTTSEAIRAITLPLPPLATQRAIVARLDSALARAGALEKRFAAIAQNAELSFKASLNEEFAERTGGTGGSSDSRSSSTSKDPSAPSKPWPLVRLGDVCEILDSRRQPITQKDRKPGSIPYYGATGVVDHVADFLFDEPLLLLGEDGAKWGASDNSAFIIDGKAWVNNHAHVLRTKPQLDRKFAMYYLNMADLSEYITGVTVPKLNQARMCSITLPLPPIPVQRAIVSRLDAARKRADGIAALARQAAEASANLRKALLKEAFE